MGTRPSKAASRDGRPLMNAGEGLHNGHSQQCLDLWPDIAIEGCLGVSSGNS